MRDATVEELLEAVISMRYMQKCCMQDKSRIRLVVRYLPTNMDVNMEVEGTTVLVAVTRRQ
jgi:hypothetical protein